VKKPVAYKDFSYSDFEKYKVKQKFYSAAAAPEESMSYATFYAPEDARPFWQRLGQLIRDNVHTGYSQMASLARPVVDPIVTASKTISANFPVFGANNMHRAQEKTGVAAPVMFGAAPLMVPAFGLVAGGAVLGLGAAAVGKYFEGTQVVHGKSHRRRRALLTGGSPLVSLQVFFIFFLLVFVNRCSF